jgi:hypothetical protein
MIKDSGYWYTGLLSTRSRSRSSLIPRTVRAYLEIHYKIAALPASFNHFLPLRPLLLKLLL